MSFVIKKIVFLFSEQLRNYLSLRNKQDSCTGSLHNFGRKMKIGGTIQKKTLIRDLLIYTQNFSSQKKNIFPTVHIRNKDMLLAHL